MKRNKSHNADSSTSSKSTPPQQDDGKQTSSRPAPPVRSPAASARQSASLGSLRPLSSISVDVSAGQQHSPRIVSRRSAGSATALGVPKKGLKQPPKTDDTASPASEAVDVSESLEKRQSMSPGSDSTARQSVSPSALDEAFASPTDSGMQTSSTRSTESNRTVRAANMPSVSADMPLRTPSYPFPYIPSRTSSTRQAPLHEPFTALSPISPGASSRGQARTRERFKTQRGTPMRSQLPRTDTQETARVYPEDHNPPDLYDIVLQLNAELSLESWWERLISITRDKYRAHRLSLAVPVDATDIENVPWGQKASFNARGLRLALSSANPSSADSWISDVSEPGFREAEQEARKAAPGRPPLASRHSYAGYEAPAGSLDDEARLPEKPKRPGFSRWMTSDTPISAANFAPRNDESLNVSRRPSVQSTANSDTKQGPNDESSEPRSICHKTLYALNREDDPLVDSAGVNRVLEKTSVVLLTREFKTDHQHTSTRKASKGNLFSSSQASGTAGTSQEVTPAYEDYEQQPATPWSRSPAPSPAIRQEPTENPFFSPGEVSEDSFEPSTGVQPDYSQGFEAIGVDSATTLIHVPLVHPTLSKVLPPLQDDGSTPVTESSGRSHSTLGPERKAPIAILSVMSNTVPYPRNLVESLGQLGPHLATSFHTCYQNSMISSRLEHALVRQTELNQPSAFSSMQTEPFALGLGLDSLLQYDNDDEISSTIGSLSSPWEGYSARSGHSTAGSPAVTPAHSNVSDSPQSYFDVRKRQSLDRSQSMNTVPKAQTIVSPTGRNITGDHRTLLRNLDVSTSGKEDKALKPQKDPPLRVPDPNINKKPEAGLQKHAPQSIDQSNSSRQPSMLHSRGADFKASFPSLPVSASRGKSRSRNTRSTYSPTAAGDSSPLGISDSLIRILIDTIPVQVFIADPGTCRIKWVNSKFLAYGGLSEYDAVAVAPWESVHGDEMKAYEAAWTKAIATGQQLQHKVRMRRFDGNYRYQYIRGAPLRTADQRIVHWVGVVTDYHDQHIAELNASKQHETAQSEAKYRALANSSPQIVFAATRSRGITFCNSQWPAYSGQSEEQARGIGFMETVHPDDLAKCKLPSFDDDNDQASNVPISIPAGPTRSRSSATSSELSGSSAASGETVVGKTDAMSTSRNLQMPQRKLSELAATGILSASRDATGKQSYSTEVRLRMKSGEYRWHLCRLLQAEPLIQAETHEQETWYGTCTDINDHKELEQTLKETMDAKSRFLSNMSHEIRTPLNGIMGMTSFLIDSVLSAEQEDHVNIIRASTEGLRDLINDILDLSKVEAGMIKLTTDWFPFRGIVEGVTDLQAAIALEKGIEVNYLVEEDVPGRLKGDAFRFRQILLNVIGNAIKFTQEGEVYIHCRRLPMSPEDYKENSTVIQIDVQDTGSGFSEKEADMLFKRFSQIDGSSTRQHGGTGLGLVISMQLVELHGGHMTATSAIGKGSCFTFTLRFGLASHDDQPPTTPFPESTEPRTAATQQEKPRTGRQSEVKASDARLEQVLAGREMIESPPTYRPDHASPSSAGSEFSTQTILTSRASSKSSQSSTGSTEFRTSMRLEMVPEDRFRNDSGNVVSPSGRVAPPPLLYSILVVCPLQWTCDAIVGHLNSIIDKDVPHNVTARRAISEANDLIAGGETLNFTHVVINVKDTEVVMALIKLILANQSPTTNIVVVCDVTQKKLVIEHGLKLDYKTLTQSRRLQFLQRPAKPSRLAAVFDPDRERELSTDVNQSTNQQFAAQQKQVLDSMADRLGDRGLKVLLVEDNKVNQKVMLRLLQRISVTVETALDGLQATDRVSKQPPGYYSIVLMDLMMPNKDGYEACKDIRAWEKRNKCPPTPIVALSANVLDDVWRKCQEAGFNSYLTKPLQFQELSDVMMKMLDPDDPSKPLEFMRKKGGHEVKHSR